MKVWVFVLREWKSFFCTPFSAVILPLYFVLCGTYFYASLDTYLTFADPGETVKKVVGLNVNVHLLTRFFSDLTNVFVLVVPLMTMRTFAEEKKMGTYDLLVSYPVRPWEILLGKYLGSLGLVLMLLAASGIYPAFVAWKGEPHMPQVFSTYLGLALFLGFYVAAGVAASLATENQLVAAVIAYGVVLLAVLFQWLAYVLASPWDAFFANFLFVAHLQSFQNGLIFTGDIALYLCSTLMVLLWGHERLRRHYVR